MALNLAELKRRSLRGGAVTMTSQCTSIGIQLTSAVVLARLLTPDDYGIMAMVLAVTGFAGLFRDLGLSSAAIQKKDLTRNLQSNLFWLNIAMGAALTAIVSTCAPLVAWFYGTPELTSLTMVLSATFLIGSIGTQYNARLIREMLFARQAIAGITGSVVNLIVSITLALNDHSYWSLVWGSLSGSLTTTLLLSLLSPFRPHLPTKCTGIRETLQFGANVTAFDFVNYFQRNLDNILLGKFWGSVQLGYYSRAYTILMLPIHAIRAPINAVAFPALSKLQNDPVEFRAYYLRTTTLLALLSMPLTAFLYVASMPIVELAFGKQWLSITPIFSYLALAAFIQPTTGFAGSLLLSLGRGKRYFQCGLLNAILTSIGFLIGIHWGPIGIAKAYVACNYIALYPLLHFALRNSPVSVAAFLRACAFPAAVSITGSAVAMLAHPYLTSIHPFKEIAGLLIAFLTPVLAITATTTFGRRLAQLYLDSIQHMLHKQT